jgi:ATP-dependent helicase/nuclease subunit A
VSAPLSPNPLTVMRQRLASDPATSAWVTANAGSGKTTVLARRVVRLLLAGVPAAKILCITFTKAAAATMALKVFEQLAGWAQATDDELREALAAIEDREPDAATLIRARRLFAAALETPGGLKVLTIHAFCDRVLHQFPFEANVPAAFAALDERAAAELMAEARGDVLAGAAAAPDGVLGGALALLVAECSDQAITAALDEMVAERALLARLLPAGAGEAGAAAVHARLAAALSADPDDDVGALDAAVLGGGIPADDWQAIAAWLGDGGETDKDLAASLLDACGQRHDPEACRQAYRRLFFKKNGAARSSGRFVTKPLRALRPDLAALLDAELARLADLDARRRAAATLARSMALTRLADAVRLRYEALKSARGGLDFADLVHKTLALLERTSAAWVLYKLDGGVDHLLVDEAQDTSPEQWAIVRRLTAEFAAGAGARPTRRTVFAVGDEKQSIYSFQGAAPEQFDEMHRAYARDFAAAGLRFEPVKLTESFRSTAEVLAGVDAVFARPEAYAGLSAEGVKTIHGAARRDGPGAVELWPPVAVPKPERPERVWDEPVDVPSAGDPAHILARSIAAAAQGWIAGRDGRPPIAPGDILVLVRTRGALFEAILGALKAAGVPVAGADRLELTGHIAVRDLLALADVLLLPDDDLSLAAVLKSPLFGWSDDDLIRIAPGRPGTLWAAIAGSAAARTLAGWAAEARACAPFDFFARVLGRDGGRRAFRSRLGPEVDDPLDEFLRLALAFARERPPSLAAFVHWMRAAPTVIKRDLDVAPAAVRVMTVHGAKGLEAPVVVLADLGAPENGRHDPKVFRLREPGAPADAPDLLVFSPSKPDDAAAVAAARADVRAARLREHRRLLYVALTRARDRLVVAGHCRADAKTGEPAVPPESWYALVRDGWTDHPGVVRAAPEPAEDAARAAAPPPAAAVEDEPDWLRRPLPIAAPAPRLRPSGSRSGGGPPEAAVLRGAMVHRLVQFLAQCPAAEREAAATRILAREGAGLSPEDGAAAAAEVLALIARPDLAPLFGPNGRSEVPIAGRIAAADGHAIRVTGRIDRLVDDGTTLHVIDFKSDRPVPATVPAVYRRQLALYARVLAEAWPGRHIRTAVLWTAAGRLDEVSPAARADALAGLAAAQRRLA